MQSDRPSIWVFPELSGFPALRMFSAQTRRALGSQAPGGRPTPHPPPSSSPPHRQPLSSCPQFPGVPLHSRFLPNLGDCLAHVAKPRGCSSFLFHLPPQQHSTGSSMLSCVPLCMGSVIPRSRSWLLLPLLLPPQAP